mgnify:CR=1 FL=1
MKVLEKRPERVFFLVLRVSCAKNAVLSSQNIVGTFVALLTEAVHLLEIWKNLSKGLADWVPYPVLTPPLSYTGAKNTFLFVEPPVRIELTTSPYEGVVLPLELKGNKDQELVLASSVL